MVLCVDGKAVVWCDRLFSNFEIYNFSNFSLRNLANYESVVTRYTPHCLWHSTIKTCFLHQPPTTKDSSLQHINTTTMSNVHGIRSSPALTQSVYPATVVQPVAVAQPRYAVYDKPADRRLRPWILLGSVLLGVCFPLLLILLLSFISWFPSYKHNTSFHYSLSHSALLLNTFCSHLSFQCMAAAMIILTFVDEGRINSLWGLFAAGCLLGGAAILGFITGFTLRPRAKALVCLSLLTISLFPHHSQT